MFRGKPKFTQTDRVTDATVFNARHLGPCTCCEPAPQIVTVLHPSEGPRREEQETAESPAANDQPSSPRLVLEGRTIRQKQRSGLKIHDFQLKALPSLNYRGRVQRSMACSLSWFLTLLALAAGGAFRSFTLAAAAGEAASSHIVLLGFPDSELELAEILERHYSLLDETLGSREEARVIYHYHHGFAALLTSKQLESVSVHPRVVTVIPNRNRALHTTDSWKFLGLAEGGSYIKHGGLWAKAKYGQGVIIGSLDTGVWPESQSYSDSRVVGRIPTKWKGICEQGEAFSSRNCNKKLIGARYYYKGFEADNGGPGATKAAGDRYLSARDSDGHGTHTSSTAAGAFVEHANLFGYAKGTSSGGAPGAFLSAYKICWSGNCSDADTLAALSQSVDDGVDVLTMSIGGSAEDYFNDSVAIGSFHAVRKGIVVVASAGNSGPMPGSVSNIAPWILTVAASSIDRVLAASAVLGNRAVLEGETATDRRLEHRMYPLISSANAGPDPVNSTLCLPGSLDRKKVRGKIVACLRGVNARVEKGAVVRDAGGVGMILCNAPVNADDVVADAHFLPAVHLSAEKGQAVYAYINSTRSPVAYITQGNTQIGIRPSPTMASFSSRGPNMITPDILKPDITAPGVNILASYTEVTSPTELAIDTRRVKFNIMSGTSMSCPHVAGVVALLKAYHPDWSPAAIKSAIITTGSLQDNANELILDADHSASATPFAFGGGHLNPNSAAHPGLIYDMSEQDYLDFLCGLGYSKTRLALFAPNAKCSRRLEARQLNYPSISVSNLSGSTTIIRRVTNVGTNGPVTYIASLEVPEGVSMTVHPAKLEFKRREQVKKFKVHFHRRRSTKGAYTFGYLTWSDGLHRVRSPIAVSTL